MVDVFSRRWIIRDCSPHSPLLCLHGWLTSSFPLWSLLCFLSLLLLGCLSFFTLSSSLRSFLCFCFHFVVLFSFAWLFVCLLLSFPCLAPLDYFVDLYPFISFQSVVLFGILSFLFFLPLALLSPLLFFCFLVLFHSQVATVRNYFRAFSF